MAFTRPKASQINFDATNISDSLIRINSSETGANTNDIGIVFERGSHTNAAIVWDESADAFRMISTTHSGDGATTDINISAHHNLHVDTLVYSSLNDGTTTLTATVAELNLLDGVTATTAELNYTDGVTSNIQTQLDARLALSGGTMTGDIVLPADGTIGSASDDTFIRFHETSTTYDGKDLSIGSVQSVHVLLDANADNPNVGGFTVRTGATSVDSSTELFKVTGTGAILADGSYDFDIASHDGTNGLKLGGTLVTSTAAELNILDGVTATATELNYLDGVTGITLGSANELLVVGTDGTSIASDSTLAVDTANNRLGINQTSPEVTLHMTGEGAQTAQIRMEQYNDTSDAPDLRTRRYRGTIASPSAVQSGDYLYRSNHEYYNGTSLVTGGSLAFDNTNNAARTEFKIAVDTDGTGSDILNGEQFKIDGNDGGAITFNDAYKFPTADGSVNQFLQTDGAGAVTFASATVSDISDLTATATELNLLDGVTGTLVTEAGTQTLTNKTLTSAQVTTDIRLNAQAELEFYDSDSSHYVSFRAPATIASSLTWTLPATDGTADQVLATNGAGTLSWADAGAGGGSGSSYPNSTFQTVPGTDGDFDLSFNVAQTTQETPFEASGTDAFGVNLGSVFDTMDPVGTTESLDYGDGEAYVGA